MKLRKITKVALVFELLFLVAVILSATSIYIETGYVVPDFLPLFLDSAKLDMFSFAKNIEFDQLFKYGNFLTIWKLHGIAFAISGFLLLQDLGAKYFKFAFSLFALICNWSSNAILDVLKSNVKMPFEIEGLSDNPNITLTAVEYLHVIASSYLKFAMLGIILLWVIYRLMRKNRAS